MKTCPNCKAQNVFEGALYCRECGASLDSSPSDGRSELSSSSDDKLDFVVVETTNTGSPDSAGETRKPSAPPNLDDDLEIKSTANLLDDGADVASRPTMSHSDNRPIGDSAPPIPIAGEIEETRPIKNGTAKAGNDSKEKVEIKKLSKEELADINRNLYGAAAKPALKNLNGRSGTPVARDLARALATDTESGGSGPDARAIDDPALGAGTGKSHKMRGVAYFRGNFIQIVGNPYLHSGDELLVNEKHYVLRPKKLSRNFTLGLIAAVFVIALIFVGSQFIGPAVSGQGEIVGLILDDNGQPYLEGARISIPKLNKSTITNAQGFFRFELVPTGTYELKYVLGDNQTGKGNVTVTGGQTTLMTFSEYQPQIEMPQISSQSGSRPPIGNYGEERPSPAQPKNPAIAKAQPNTEYASIELMANVADARLSIDDRIVGSGNNIYTRIKPGYHRIKVDKAGYSEYATQIELKADQTVAVTANLTPITSKAAGAASAEDLVTQGNQASGSGDHQKAVELYSRALEQSPNFKDAYARRAEAYARLGNQSSAVQDYIRLGEIYRLNNNDSKAMSAFTSALTIEPENKIALAGRGGAKLDNGDFRSALTDFEAAVKIDAAFYPAVFGTGICHHKLGNNKQADKYFREAYKINPSDPYLYQYMMLNYLALDDVKKLRKTYAEYKMVASPSELAEFKSSSRFSPIIRLVGDENR